MATETEKNCTLKFSDDVAMTAALREATAVDRKVVEEIRIEVEGIDQSFQEELEDINLKHADVVQKHGEVIAAKDEVNTRKAEIDVIQADVTDQQTDVTNKRDEVNNTYNAVNDQASQVDSDKNQVAADKAAVTQTINNFNTTTADTLQSVVDEGNTQVLRVTNKGTEQNTLLIDTGAVEQSQVQQEGITQKALITTASSNEQSDIENKGTEQVSRVHSKGDEQEIRIEATGDIQDARIVAEGDTQFARSGAEADRAKAEADTATAQATIATTAKDETLAAANSIQDNKDFVEQVTTQFGDVDAAIAGAATEADRAAHHDLEANKSKISAQQAERGAVQAKDDAVAIVHEGEGSILPAAGKYPIADSDGVLNIGWTPLLQAMYPYSGVIGSVDKLDIFHFAQASSVDSNRFSVRGNSVLRANINGRFVEVPNTVITLPPAESTADRAIAFDDIFLNWDGEIITYRSITPHRTTTGYDRDLIATEHGYTKVNTGLYKTGETYALLLGRVARRNQGAYHPVFNPEGTTGFYRERDPEEETRRHTSPWFYTSIIKENITFEDCLDEVHVPLSTASISNPNTSLKLRPNKEAYDAIYADDFTPLYYSAKNVIDRQALLFDSFNRAVAGETFSGAEGTISFPQLVDQADYRNSFSTSEPTQILISQTSVIMSNAVSTSFALTPTHIPLGTQVQISFTVSDSTGGNIRLIVYSDGDYDGTMLDISASGNYTLLHKVGTFDGDFGSDRGRIRFVASASGSTATFTNIETFITKAGDSARPQFLMTDIIGSLDAMPEEWKTEGIPGNWLAVGEEGESLIPDGTSKNFKLSRKCLECYQVLSTVDNGQSWNDDTVNWKSGVEGSGNSRGADLVQTACYMIFYRTAANPFELADSVQSYCEAMAYGNNSYATPYGVQLGSCLINKIATSTDHGYAGRYLTIDGFYRISGGSFGSYGVSSPETTKTVMQNNSADSPAWKAFPYLSQLSGITQMSIYYKEIKHNGTQWGDDNKFNIVDNQSTVTDLNGETVIVGQKRVSLPYHFDGEQY